MTLGGLVASRYMWPHPGGYTPLNIIVGFVAVEILIIGFLSFAAGAVVSVLVYQRS